MPVEPGVSASYDRVASLYAANVASELDNRPLERGLLDAFASLVGPGSGVADVGCGPGHITAYLVDKGVDAFGIDLSPGMVEVAKTRRPDIAFEVGSMLDLPVTDASLDGALAWFSVIHVDDHDRPRAYAELARVVREGGWLMIGFHVEGDSSVGHRRSGEVARITTWWDQDVDLEFHFLDPAQEIASLRGAGWKLVARLDREPMVPTEPQTRRSYLVLTKSS